MTTYQFSCTIGTTDPTAQLGMEIWIDNAQLYANNHVTETAVPLQFDLDEDESAHELRFIMTGKTYEHTTIDSAGNIVKDTSLTVSNVMFDKIALNQLVVDHAVYTHDFNGSQDQIQDKFYGIMGCNGEVKLKFATPIYLWLLEHM